MICNAYHIGRSGEDERSIGAKSYRDRWNQLQGPAKVHGALDISLMKRRRAAVPSSSDEMIGSDEEAALDPLQASKLRRKRNARRKKFYKVPGISFVFSSVSGLVVSSSVC